MATNPRTTSPREGFIDSAWKFDSAWSLATRYANTIGGVFDSFEHSIRVSVTGGPEADIRRVWYLACSLAFGRYRNRVRDGLAETSMQGVWDVSSKTCAVELFYRVNRVNQTLKPVVDAAIAGLVLLPPGVAAMIAGSITGSLGVVRGDPTSTTQSFMHRGPEQLTVGADWPDWLTNAGSTLLASRRVPRVVRPRVDWVGIPCFGARTGFTVAGRNVVTGGMYGFTGVLREWPVVLSALGIPFGASYPARVAIGVGTPPFGVQTPDTGTYMTNTVNDVTLPDDGRVITTAEKLNALAQPPVPPVDGVGRYNALVGLVAQALTCPCFLPQTPACTDRPQANGTGLRLYPAGTEAPQTWAGLDAIIGPARLTGSVSDLQQAFAYDMTEVPDICTGAKPAPPVSDVTITWRTSPAPTPTTLRPI